MTKGLTTKRAKKRNVLLNSSNNANNFLATVFKDGKVVQLILKQGSNEAKAVELINLILKGGSQYFVGFYVKSFTWGTLRTLRVNYNSKVHSKAYDLIQDYSNHRHAFCKKLPNVSREYVALYHSKALNALKTWEKKPNIFWEFVDTALLTFPKRTENLRELLLPMPPEPKNLSPIKQIKKIKVGFAFFKKHLTPCTSIFSCSFQKGADNCWTSDIEMFFLEEPVTFGFRKEEDKNFSIRSLKSLVKNNLERQTTNNQLVYSTRVPMASLTNLHVKPGNLVLAVWELIQKADQLIFIKIRKIVLPWSPFLYVMSLFFCDAYINYKLGQLVIKKIRPSYDSDWNRIVRPIVANSPVFAPLRFAFTGVFQTGSFFKENLLSLKSLTDLSIVEEKTLVLLVEESTTSFRMAAFYQTVFSHY